MQAITTKFYGPTQTRGARLSAKAAAGRLSVSYDHGLSLDENHAAAAAALMERLGWTEAAGHTKTAAGTLPNGDYAHVFMPRTAQRPAGYWPATSARLVEELQACPSITERMAHRMQPGEAVDVAEREAMEA